MIQVSVSFVVWDNYWLSHFFVNRDFGMQEYNYKAICLNRDKTQENRQNRGKNTPMFICDCYFRLTVN